MIIEDLKGKLKDFTIKCIENRWQDNKSYNKIMEILKESNSVKDFTDNVIKGKIFDSQAYWEIAKEVLKSESYRKLVIEYLDEISGVKCFETFSDKGSVKIGNRGFSVDIGNLYGDDSNEVYVIEDKKNLKGLNCALNFVTGIGGNNINLYDYDCGDSICYKFEGVRYGIYRIERLVVFQNWN